MSGKSRLTLALLGATAFFTFNPGVISSIIHADETLSAEEMSLSQSSEMGLNSLTDSSNDLSGSVNGANEDLAPRHKNADLMSPVGETARKENFAAVETPFAATSQKPVVVLPQVDKMASNPEAFPIDKAMPVAVDAKVIADVNPFVDPNAVPKKTDLGIQLNDAAAKKVKIDDGALRYYAASKDLKRLGAEMRRLKTLYPDWQPPKDLFSPTAQVSEQPLWDLYKLGDYAAVRARIALMQSANPKWQPSDDLTLKLQMGESRMMISRAFAQRRWQQVIAAAQASPSMLVCDEMQILWDVGEAFARTRDYAQSFELYKYILSSCSDPALRLSTIQKASLLLPSQGVASLISFGRMMPDGASEFENIGFDGVRRQIGEFIQHGDFAAAPSDDDLKRFVDFVQRTASSTDAGLIGWYFYSQEEWKLANSWFIEAAQYERTPKNIEGVIMTLRNMEKPEDALKIARRYMKASPEITKQYVEIIASSLTADTPEVTLKDKEITDFEKVVADQKSPLGAQALGWKYLAGGDRSKAGDWFADSVKWEPTEGGVIGLAVLASRSKDYKTLSAIKTKYLKTYASLQDFKIYNSSKTYKWKKFKKRNSMARNTERRKKRIRSAT